MKLPRDKPQRNNSISHYHYILRTCNFLTAQNSDNTLIQPIYENRVEVLKKICWLKHKLANLPKKNYPPDYAKLCSFIRKELRCNKSSAIDYARATMVLGIYRKPKVKGTPAEQDLIDFINTQYGK